MKGRVVLHKEQGSSGKSSMPLVRLKINTVKLRLMRADHDPRWLKAVVQKAHQPDGRQETYSSALIIQMTALKSDQIIVICLVVSVQTT